MYAPLMPAAAAQHIGGKRGRQGCVAASRRKNYYFGDILGGELMLKNRSASSYHEGGYMALQLSVYSLYFLKYVKRVLARSVLVLPGDVPL